MLVKYAGVTAYHKGGHEPEEIAAFQAWEGGEGRARAWPVRMVMVGGRRVKGESQKGPPPLREERGGGERT